MEQTAYLRRLNKESSWFQISWIAACFVPAVTSSWGVIQTEEAEKQTYIQKRMHRTSLKDHIFQSPPFIMFFSVLQFLCL